MPKNFKKWANIAVVFLLCFSLVVNIHCVLLLFRYRQIYQATPVWMAPTGEQMMVVPVVTPTPSMTPVTPSPEPTLEPIVEEVSEAEPEIAIEAEIVPAETVALSEDVPPISETEPAAETVLQETPIPQVTEKPKAKSAPQVPAKTQVTEQPKTAVSSAGSNLYITKSGSKYHREGCSSLSKSQIPISYEDAVAKGYEPCGRCNP